MADVRVCSVDDLAPGSARRVDVDGHRLALVRLGESEWRAVADRCSHAEASLAEGEVYPKEREIECPKHGSIFSLETGEPLTLPATQAVAVYPVRVEGDDVVVSLP